MNDERFRENRRRTLGRLSSLAGGGAAIGAGLPLPAPVLAQDRRKELLIVANEFGPNSLDIHGVGANRPSYGVAWVVYDRLMTYGRRKLADGSWMYDYAKLEPELAERWEIAKDGASATFFLRKDARFHDGSPVTAQDVKWSFDRALGMGGFPQFQMKAGSLEDPSQFEALDDKVFRVKFVRRDKLSMPDMAVPVASIYNATLAKKHATADDPWAASWLKSNTAGGGAYKVESWKPGQEIVYVRYDDWKSGPLPKMRRVIQRDVPSAGNRRALLVKGDIDMTYDLPPKDFAELSADKSVRIASLPIENAMFYLGMNVTRPPFNNPKVRQAVAWALPYDKMNDVAMYGRGVKLYGGPSNAVKTTAWPAPTAYRTDPARAKALMAEAGASGGFETTLSYDLGAATVSEPMAILIQEALAGIGIRLTINKVPGANWRAALLKKDMPMIINRFGGWLNYPEYFFFWCYHGQNAVFNTMSYQNADLDRMITNARFAESKALYEGFVKDMIRLAYDEVPRVPLFQPMADVAMQKNIEGYTYWFHLQPDFRQLAKT